MTWENTCDSKDLQRSFNDLWHEFIWKGNRKFLLRTRWDTSGETEKGRDSMPSRVSDVWRRACAWRCIAQSWRQSAHAMPLVISLLSRLVRPDLSFAVQRLAIRITRWTLWEDRQMLRLTGYVHSTAGLMIYAKVDPDESPELVVYTDSDFASCPHTAKSTSGVLYILKTGDARYPLLWSSKKKVQQRNQLLKQS